MSAYTSILIIDDNIVNITLAKTILELEGFTIYTSNNGTDGRALARELKPNLILLDIDMPEEDGFITCHKLKNDPNTRFIPVIFLSGCKDVDMKLKGLSMDVLDYITKPFEPKELIARVKLYIRLFRNELRLLQYQMESLKNISLDHNEKFIKPEEMPNAKFQVFNLPLMDLGGDFYDVVELVNGVYGYFCSDVCGHDASASLTTASFHTLIHQNASILYSPETTFQIMNKILLETIPEEKYLSAVYLKLNRNNLSAQIISAGHTPVIILPKNHNPYVLELTGDLLGLFDTVSFDEISIEVNERDRIFLYSDGVIEKYKGAGRDRNSGLNRFLQLIKDYRDFSLKEQIDLISKAILIDLDKEQEDDILILGVEV